MRYRPFGNTGATVSALGFGAMRLPMTPDGEHVDEDRAIPVIQRALELGINYLDTAPYYCKGESEIVLGKAIKGWRDRVYISTKNPLDNPDPGEFRAWLEKSLRKLDVDYIDFYHMWGMNKVKYETMVATPGGRLDEARKAKEEGLIRHISFSFHDTPEVLERFIDTGYFESMTVQYNLLDRANEAAIARAAARGMGVVIMGPVGGGRLAETSPEIRKLLPNGVSGSPELALRFVLSHPGVHVALSGMSTIQMVEENAATASREEPLSANERQAIAQTMDQLAALANLYCTGCGYCMPCPNDVNIPENFKYMNYYRVYGLAEYARQAYAQLGSPGNWIKGLKADACIQCGECEPKCPQHIPIIKQLEEVAEVLGGKTR
ncbi:MAG: aldo/keto reductase [Chloroflexi bacterium]|nr:aldo/keto reductase [Chloroflexota bacterium]